MSLITGNVKKGVRVSFSATLFMLCFVNIGHLLQNFKYRHTQIYTQQPAHVFFSKESRPIKLSSSYIFNLLPVSISCICVWFEVFTLVNIRWQSFEIWRHLFWRGVARDLLLPSSKRRVFPSSKTLLPAHLSKYAAPHSGTSLKIVSCHLSRALSRVTDKGAGLHICGVAVDSHLNK